MATYRFDDIVHLKHHAFRLFKLLPGSGTDYIQGEISVHELQYKHEDIPESESPLRVYDALSYHWGASGAVDVCDPFIQIVVDEERYQFQVTHNLASALRRLRQENDPRTLWVDALCIDQRNAQEKALQIPFISKIYNHAHCVHIWLGDGDDHSAAAFRFIHTCQNAEVFDKLRTDRDAATSWAALVSLMRRSWFNRRWIVQEIALAREATLYCGDDHVRWREFADVVSQLSEKHQELRSHFVKLPEFVSHPHHLCDIAELDAVRLVNATDDLVHKTADGHIEEMQLSLEEVICSLSSFKASDPHDTIYAILSLANDTHEAHEFVEPATSLKRAHKGEIIDGSPVRQNRPINLGIIQPPDNSLDIVFTKDETTALSGPDQAFEDPPSDYPPSDDQPSDGPPSDVPPSNDPTKSRACPSTSLALLSTNGRSNPRRPRLKSMIHRASRSFAKQKNISSARTPKERAQIAIDTLVDLVDRRYLIFHLDYKKSIFHVCKDLLIFTISRSKSLDILCRPWAPEDPNDHDFPSWIPRLKKSVAFETDHLGVYRRVNADPLLGKPEPRGPPYRASASPNLKPYWEFFPPDDERERSLIVRGFVLDTVKQDRIKRNATSGTVPADWISTARCHASDKSFPPDAFWRTLVGDRNRLGRRAPPYWRLACRDAFLRGPKDHDLETSDMVMHDVPSSTQDFVHRMRCVIWNRRLVCMSNECHALSFCLAPEDVQGGDFICVLYGCNVPVVLRREFRGTKSVYRFIGECYVHGAMDGEAVRIRAKMTRHDHGWGVQENFDQLFELV